MFSRAHGGCCRSSAASPEPPRLTELAPGETQDGLAKGIIDGATSPYEGAQSFDIGTVVKYCIEPGISASTFVAVMNPKRFDSLPAKLQALIASTTGPVMAAKVGAALVIVGFGGNWALTGWDSAFALLGTTPFDTASIYTLSVVPLFILTGGIAAVSGLSTDLFRAAQVLLSGLRVGCRM